MHFFCAWEPVMKGDTILLNVKIAFETGHYRSRDSCELLAFLQESLQSLIADWLDALKLIKKGAISSCTLQP